MKYLICLLLVFSSYSFSAPKVDRVEDGPRHRVREILGGGVGSGVAGSAIYDALKEAVRRANAAAKKHEENIKKKIRDMQEADRKRDIESGRHSGWGRRDPHPGKPSKLSVSPEEE